MGRIIVQTLPMEKKLPAFHHKLNYQYFLDLCCQNSVLRHIIFTYWRYIHHRKLVRHRMSERPIGLRGRGRRFRPKRRQNGSAKAYAVQIGSCACTLRTPLTKLTKNEPAHIVFPSDLCWPMPCVLQTLNTVYCLKYLLISIRELSFITW
jgi:hypothetical protein